MKTIITHSFRNFAMQILFMAICLGAAAQVSQNMASGSTYQQFLENQKTPLTWAGDDACILENVVWKRVYGEKEYYLPPMTDNRNEYLTRITKQGVEKAKFRFIRLEATSSIKPLLSGMNIQVPKYISGSLLIYLPQIDIDALQNNNVMFSYASDYGLQKFTGGSNPSPQATIYSNDFETKPFPGTDFTTQVQNASCGWGAVNCMSSTWSIWCSESGTACNPSCDDYINNQTSWVDLKAISISAYMNVVFTFYRYSCLNGGTADYSQRWDSYDGNVNWTPNVKIDGTDGNDCGNWIQGSTSIPPGSPYYGVSWLFYSDGSFTGGSSSGYGVWVDDLMLTGAVNGLNDLEVIPNLSLYPNPARDYITITCDQKLSMVSILNVLGETVYSAIIESSQKTIGVSNLVPGIYSMNIYSKSGFASKKIVIQ